MRINRQKYKKKGKIISKTKKKKR